MAITTTVLIIAAIKSLQSCAPVWDKEVESWIKEDEQSFRLFKNKVFTTVSSHIHQLGSDGFEKL